MSDIIMEDLLASPLTPCLSFAVTRARVLDGWVLKILDFASLKSCTLVCSDWHFLAKPLLLAKSIRLRLDPDDVSDPPVARIADFIDFATRTMRPPRGLAGYVPEYKIGSMITHFHLCGRIVDGSITRGDIKMSHLRSILSSMPALQAIRFSELQISLEGTKPRVWANNQVSTLQLWDVTAGVSDDRMSSVIAAYALLSYCGSVKTFSVCSSRDCRVRSAIETVDPYDGPELTWYRMGDVSVETLDLTSVPLSPFCDLIQSSMIKMTLTELSVKPHETNDLLLLNALVMSNPITKQLRKLNLELSSYDPTEGCWSAQIRAGALSNMAQLQSLSELCIKFTISGGNLEAMVNRALDVVIAAPSLLSVLKIDFIFADDENGDNDFVSQLDHWSRSKMPGKFQRLVQFPTFQLLHAVRLVFVLDVSAAQATAQRHGIKIADGSNEHLNMLRRFTMHKVGEAMPRLCSTDHLQVGFVPFEIGRRVTAVTKNPLRTVRASSLP